MSLSFGIFKLWTVVYALVYFIDKVYAVRYAYYCGELLFPRKWHVHELKKETELSNTAIGMEALERHEVQF